MFLVYKLYTGTTIYHFLCYRIYNYNEDILYRLLDISISYQYENTKKGKQKIKRGKPIMDDCASRFSDSGLETEFREWP